MNDRQAAAIKKRIVGILADCIPVMGLDSWNFTVEYERETWPDDKHTQALCYPSWEYLNVTIRFYLPALVDCYTDDQKLRNIVLHELAHCLVNPAESGKGKPLEFAVEQVALAIERAYQFGQEKGR